MFPETLTATRNSRCVANPPRLPARARCLHVPRTPDSFRHPLRHPLLSLVDVLTDYSDSFSHAQQQGYYYQDARQQASTQHRRQKGKGGKGKASEKDNDKGKDEDKANGKASYKDEGGANAKSEGEDKAEAKGDVDRKAEVEAAAV